MHRTMRAEELAEILGTPSAPFIVDVREPDEFAEWSIPTALNIPLGTLPSELQALPRDREIVTHCAAGSRSAQAARILDQQGFRVAELDGGMAAWAAVYDFAEVVAGAATIVQVRRRAKGCLSYVVGAGDDAFVVDPSADLDVYERVARRRGWSITRVFDTHLHADHLSGTRTLAERNHATLHLNPADAFDFNYSPLHDGDRFALPGDVTFGVTVIHTPGHTEGSTIYTVADEAVMTGDTLFVDGVGRPDLAERAAEFAQNLYRSIQDRVLPLGDEVVVLPAHYGPDVEVRPGAAVAATIGELRERLEPLRLNETEFVTWAAESATERPPNYVEIIKANMGRARLSHEALRELELGPNRCSVSA